MPVDEETRHDVYEDLKRVHGAKRAGAMMAMMPPAGVPELATKADIGVLKADVGVLKADVGGLKADVGGLKADVGGLKADVGVLKADVGVLKADVDVLRAEMAALEARLEGRIDALRADLYEAMHDQTTRYIRWMLTGMALMGSLFTGVVVVVSGLPT